MDNILRVWDTRSDECVREVKDIHSNQICAVQSSPDRRLLLTMSRDNTLQVVDSRTYLPLQTLRDEGFRLNLAWSKPCFSPDGTKVVAGGQDGSLFFWNTLTGQLQKSMAGHQSAICSVCWNPLGGSLVYSADYRDRQILFWEE